MISHLFCEKCSLDLKYMFSLSMFALQNNKHNIKGNDKRPIIPPQFVYEQ